MGPHVTELVHQGKAAEDGPVLHPYMPTEGRRIGQDDVVADPAVVGHMGIGHEEIVIADAGLDRILHGAAVNGGPLAHDDCGHP